MSTSPSSNGDSSPQRPVDSLARYLLEVVGEPVDEPLLLRALTHRSYAYENGGLPHNERLEFLGDSVLGLVVTDSLYREHPDLPEGQLAKLRAAVVNMRALADVARTLGLGDYLLLGRGEESTGGRDKASILADTMEAVIGTVYLSVGHAGGGDVRAPPARPADAQLGQPRRRPGLEDQPAGADRLGLARRPGVPRHRGGARTTRRSSPPARSSATRSSARASGRSKKEAEQKSAEIAWTELSRRAEAALVPTRSTPASTEAADTADA